MAKLGKRLIRTAEEARALARTETAWADPDDAPDLSAPEWQARFATAPVDGGRTGTGQGRTLTEPAPDRGYTKEDWNAVSDAPEATDEELAQAKPFAEAFPALAATIKRTPGQRGPQKAPTKVAVTLRIDRDTVESFKAAGPGWQSRMNEALGKAAKRQPRG